MFEIEKHKFDDFYVRNVKLDLETCVMNMEVIFTNKKNKIIRVKDYQFKTNCDVDINHYVEILKKKLNGF
jgi:DNA polymerase III epsilon subunit-like protein